MKPAKETFPLRVVEGNVTVKIYRRDRTAEGKGFSYEVADYSGGTRRLRSFADLGDAKAEASKLARLLSSGQVHAASITNPDAASYGRSIALLAGTEVELELATATFAEAFRIVGSVSGVIEAAKLYAEMHRGVTARPVRDAVTDYIAHKESSKASRRYVEDLRSRLGRFASAFACDVHAITTPTLQTWVDALRLGPQTTRNFRTVLRGFFGYCRSKGWCSAIPTDRMTTTSVKGTGGETDDGEIQTFTPDELSRLLHAAPPDFLPCLVLGAFCGLRSAEIERVHWEDIKLSTGNVVLKRGKSKTRNRRIAPLCPAAQAWLAPYATRTGPVWSGTHDAFYNAQEATAAAAGVEWKANGLRHGFASHRLAQTKDEVRVAYELGNSPVVVRGHYDALVDEKDAAAWFNICPAKPANVTALPAKEAA